MSFRPCRKVSREGAFFLSQEGVGSIVLVPFLRRPCFFAAIPWSFLGSSICKRDFSDDVRNKLDCMEVDGSHRQALSKHLSGFFYNNK